jgi:hypothetical protein
VQNGRAPHTLTVDPQNGGFEFRGHGIVLPQGGISAGDKPANNLRGIAVPVPADSTSIQVHFDRPEADEHYAIMAQPNWFTLDAVTEKTAAGFTVDFNAAPPQEGGQIDWMLLR